MKAIIKRILETNKKSIFIYTGITVIFVWMYVALYPSMQKQGEQLLKLLENYPQGFLDAFGFDVSNVFTSLEAFLSTEHYSLIFPLILIILLISFGGYAIAGEVDDGTIEILVSQPISRTKLFFAKYIGSVVIMLIFILIAVFSVVPFALLHNVDFQLSHYFTMFLLSGLFGLSIFSITIMFSSFFSTKGKAASLVAGILIIMYAINIVANLKDSLENFKYLSFFYYYDASAALVDNRIDVLSIIVLLLVSLTCSAIGLVVFNKRDIAT